MPKSAQQYVFEGLELLLDALIPFVRERLPRRRGRRRQTHEQQIDDVLHDLDRRSGRGLGALLRIMKRFWRDGFKTVLGQDELSLVNELTHVCDRHARNEAFSDNDADRALDSMRRLAKAAGASTAAEQLGAMRNEILAGPQPDEERRLRPQPAPPPPKPSRPPLRQLLHGDPHQQPPKPPPAKIGETSRAEAALGTPQTAFSQSWRDTRGVMYMVRSKNTGFDRDKNEVHFEKFLKRGVIAVGWPELGDLSRFESREAIREEWLGIHPGLSRQSAAAQTGNLFRFSRELPKSDFVITYRSDRKLYAVGKITGEYTYDPDFFAFQEDNFPNIIPVNWNSVQFRRSDLSGSAQAALGAQLTVFRLKNEAVVEEILSLVRNGWQ